ncbi:MAG: hypothetical protein JWO38_7071 [Gemmataceae bacterium]|nr:hypothetical protein [Gemmataceae bacterium]
MSERTTSEPVTASTGRPTCCRLLDSFRGLGFATAGRPDGTVAASELALGTVFRSVDSQTATAGETPA